MPLAERIVTASIGVIAIYLIVKNPTGDSAVLNSLGGVFTSGAKTLQGR